ncbi:hypothetical protein LJC72_05490 [Bacteroides sp. OttesenSCG-928-D19]|nr:hypothetical protein [Bacteroides sp. OttesenSCG-928-D19]
MMFLETKEFHLVSYRKTKGFKPGNQKKNSGEVPVEKVSLNVLPQIKEHY